MEVREKREVTKKKWKKMEWTHGPGLWREIPAWTHGYFKMYTDRYWNRDVCACVCMRAHVRVRACVCVCVRVCVHVHVRVRVLEYLCQCISSFHREAWKCGDLVAPSPVSTQIFRILFPIKGTRTLSRPGQFWGWCRQYTKWACSSSWFQRGRQC